MSTKLEPLLSLDEVGKILKMSAGWVQGEIKAGRLKQTKLGKIVRVEPCDLRAFIDDWKRKSNVGVIVETLRISADFDTDAAILKVTQNTEG